MTEEQAQDLERYDRKAFNYVRLWLVSFAILLVVGLLISGCTHTRRHVQRDTKPLIAQHYDYWELTS